jgi:hypothetical protein
VRFSIRPTGPLNHRRRPPTEVDGRYGGAVKVIGVIRSKELQTVEVEASSYEEGRQALDQQVPEGWELQHIRTEK